jgi:predicted DNA-binding transcriptional regulator AlpA
VYRLRVLDGSFPHPGRVRLGREGDSKEGNMNGQEILIGPVDELLTGDQTAAKIGVEPQTLAVWRSTKRYGLPYIKVGHLVRYKLSDIEAWLATRTVRA